MCFLSVECVFLPKISHFFSISKKFKDKYETAFFYKKYSRKKFKIISKKFIEVFFGSIPTHQILFF
jgi:hypothetical protein